MELWIGVMDWSYGVELWSGVVEKGYKKQKQIYCTYIHRYPTLHTHFNEMTRTISSISIAL